MISLGRPKEGGGQKMGEWKKTGCVLCGQNCGLEVLVEGNRMIRVRPDKDNPRSEGYICRKGLNVASHHHHDERLYHPLKRTRGGFERISWNQALEEISERIRSILEKHGPRAIAYMGGGGQGCHFEAAFGVRFLRGLGSKYHYSALAQELTGYFWAWGRITGRQYLFAAPDHHRTEVLVALGWNGMQSHQMPQARRFLTAMARDPKRVLVVVDPRLSETAKIADIHLPVRPGTDALLLKAMIKIVLENKWENKEYLARWVKGFDEVREWFEGFDPQAACRVCQLDYKKVVDVAELIAKRKSSIHPDLGVLMNRHSTATTYLAILLMAICGRIGTEGGNVFYGYLMPLGSHSDERDPENWRTVATGYPAIMGTYPPNVMPEEILSDHPERLRAVICSQSNPLRSYADTTAYEEAFSRLDLLVTCELAMTETAAISHYVLPARSGYESWDGTFFAWTFPEIYFQMRRPIVEPEGERWEVSQIFVALAEKLGLIPPIPEQLREAAASGDRVRFGALLMGLLRNDQALARNLPFVLAKTLGQQMGSANLASLWGLLNGAPGRFRKWAARVGFDPGPLMGEEIFKAILEHPEGLWIGRCDPEENLEVLCTEDGKLHIHIPEMAQWVKSITPESEEMGLEREKGTYPLVLMAGRHMDTNANTLMRDPSWNQGKRACTLAMHPEDARRLGLEDGQMVRVVTDAGSVEIELEIDESSRVGTVIMPHGFGLVYKGKEFGANVNRLTSSKHRDPIAGTPLHRFVPCRVEAIENVEAKDRP
jgi:anaerobic selenocysteine-containing dehydrogenase